MVYKFYIILILILPWFKGGNADFPVRYIIYSGFAICLLSLVYGNSQKFVRSINKYIFLWIYSIHIVSSTACKKRYCKRKHRNKYRELKENINLNSGIGKKLLNIINNLNYITKENVYYSLFNIKNEIYYKFNSVELSDKDMINTIYRKILDNYSPYIPILNFQKFSNLLLFCIIINFAYLYHLIF